MPCSDVADAIVLFGRDTLERSIRLVNGHKEWGARVWLAVGTLLLCRGEPR